MGPALKNMNRVKIPGHSSNYIIITTWVMLGFNFKACIILSMYQWHHKKVKQLPNRSHIVHRWRYSLNLEQINSHDAIEIAELALDNLYAWFTTNRLKLNEWKTMFLYANIQYLENPLYYIHTDLWEIKKVQYFKLLGVYTDEGLTLEKTSVIHVPNWAGQQHRYFTWDISLIMMTYCGRLPLLNLT